MEAANVHDVGYNVRRHLFSSRVETWPRQICNSLGAVVILFDFNLISAVAFVSIDWYTVWCLVSSTLNRTSILERLLITSTECFHS